MPRKAILAVVIVAIAALAAWRFGLLGPLFSTLNSPSPESDAPALAEVADGSSKAPVPATLASGGKRQVARSKAPVDGPRITGKVVDRAGAGIPDARVVSMPDRSKEAFRLEQIGSEGSPGADAITDADGKFVVAVSNDAPYHGLVAMADGYGAAFKAGMRAGSDVTLVLDRAASISGTVMDHEGTPVVGAKVRVHVLLDAFAWEREATSGAGGAYQIEGLPSAPKGWTPWAPGFSSAVEVTAEGYAPVLAMGIASLQPGKEVNRDFVLGRGASVAGRVVDADTGDPIESARVVLWSQEGEGGAYSSSELIQAPWTPRKLDETKSAKDGTFQFDHVPAQGFHPLLSTTYGRKGLVLGYVGATKDGSCGASEEIPFAKPGARTEVTLKLWPAAIVEGRVVDSAGVPVVKATVGAEVQERPVALWLPKTIFGEVANVWIPGGVGADGKYRLSGVPVPRKGPREVTVRGSWPERPGIYAFRRAGGDGSVTVQLSAGTTMTAPDLVLRPSEVATPDQATPVEIPVRVVAAGGVPVWGAKLLVYLDGEQLDGEVQTDREGKAVVGWMKSSEASPSAVALTVRARGYAPVWKYLDPSMAGADPVQVTMQAPHRLRGRVVGSDGAPVSGAYVSVGNGALKFDEVFPDPSARGVGMAPAATPRTPERSPKPTYTTTTADEQGRFDFEDLPEGPYHLIAGRIQRAALPLGGKPAPRGVLADVASEAVDVLIQLPPDTNPPTGALEGAVVDAATGRPVPGLLVTIGRGDEIAGSAGTNRGGMMLSSSATAAGLPSIPSPGRYEFPYVPAGTWSVVASGEGYLPKTLEGVTIRAGETTTAPAVRLERGATVRGRITAPDGISLADRMFIFSEVEGEGAFGRSLIASVAADGSYSLSGFTPGLWRLISRKEGSDPSRDPALIPARDEKVQVREADSALRFDATLVFAGAITVHPQDDRLPLPPSDRGSSTEEQKAFGDACRVVVKAADGTVAAEQKGKITRGSAGRVSRVFVLPGRYTVRLEMPGGEVREETVEVAAGAQATVTLAKK